MAGTDVNLLRTVSGRSVQQSAIGAQVRLVGWISICAFIVAGTVSFVLFLLVQNFLAGAQKKETLLADQLKALGNIEGLYESIQNRLGIISHVIAIQDNYQDLSKLISRTSSDSGILAYSFDGESNAVGVKYSPRSIFEANELAGTIFNMQEERIIKLATLNSVSLGSDGNVSIVASFYPQ